MDHNTIPFLRLNSISINISFSIHVEVGYVVPFEVVVSCVIHDIPNSYSSRVAIGGCWGDAPLDVEVRYSPCSVVGE